MPESLEDLLRTADALLLGGDPLDALDILARAVEAWPSDPEPFIRQADILIALGGRKNLMQARLGLDHALALDAETGPVYFSLMRALHALDEVAAAREAYAAACALAPDDGRLREWGVRLALAEGELERALTLARAELAAAPQDFHWMRWQAELLYIMGDLPAARDAYSTLIAVHLPASLAADDWSAAQWGAILLARAGILLALGDDVAASTDIERASTLIPDDPGVSFARGLLQWRGGDPASAFDVLRAALQRAAPDVRAALWPALAGFPRLDALYEALRDM